MLSLITMYPGSSLALSGAGLLALFAAQLEPRQRRLGLALIVLAPISPFMLVGLLAHLAADFYDRAINAFGPLSDLWAWAARTIASGGRR